MKMQLSKKKFISILAIIAVFLFLGILSIVFGDDIKNRFSQTALEKAILKYDCEIPSDYNAFFDESSYLAAGFHDMDGREIWEMHKILPYVLGYEDIGGVKYMIAGVKNSEEGCTKMALILSGNFNQKVTRYLEKDWMKIIWLNEEESSFEEFKVVVKPGMQIEAYYLTRMPVETQPDSICMSGLGSQSFCAYQELCNQYKCNVEKFQDYVDFTETKLLYVTSLSLIENEAE